MFPTSKTWPLGLTGLLTTDSTVTASDAVPSLSPARPASFLECENRVRWVLENLSRGELALLYKALYEAEGMRYDQTKPLIKKLQDEYNV